MDNKYNKSRIKKYFTMANKRAAEQETDSEICHRLMRAIQIGLRNNDSVHIENMLAKFEDDLEWRCSLAGVADHVGDEMVLNVNEEIRKCLLTEKTKHRWERIYAPVAPHESSDSEHYEVEGGPTDYNSDFSDEDSPEDHMYQPVEINSSDDDDSEDEGDSDTQEESESASDEAQEESGSGSEDEEEEKEGEGEEEEDEEAEVGEEKDDSGVETF